MKKNLAGLTVAFVLCSMISIAHALPITATITADNHYALYYGNETGSDITFVGKNEAGISGSPGSYNWSLPETFSFNADVGEYLYVAAWSDDRVAQGWIGQFVTDTYEILSNTSDWEVFLTFEDLDNDAPAPTTGQIGTQVSSASWSAVTDSIPNGGYPWGTIGSISEDADWIWGSALRGGSAYGEYQIFRTKVSEPVPEPATLVLFGIGLTGLAGIRSRKKQK